MGRVILLFVFAGSCVLLVNLQCLLCCLLDHYILIWAAWLLLVFRFGVFKLVVSGGYF